MKIISVAVYTYNELTPAAQEKAREWYREASQGDDWWSQQVIEDAQQCALCMGLTVDKVYFSGFSSQGDGACFDGSWRADKVIPCTVVKHAPLDKELHRIAAEFERIAKLLPDASFKVKHDGRYYHRYETEFDVSWGDAAEDELRQTYEEELVEAARDFMQWIYRQLEKQWDYVNSDEAVAESIEANGYTFTTEGARFN